MFFLVGVLGGGICHQEYQKVFRAFVLCMLFQKGNYLRFVLLILRPLVPLKMMTILVIQVPSPIQVLLKQVKRD